MDPRTANCQGYHVDANGKVDGVLLIWQPVPSSKYELIRAELVSEADAGGSTVATAPISRSDSGPDSPSLHST